MEELGLIAEDTADEPAARRETLIAVDDEVYRQWRPPRLVIDVGNEEYWRYLPVGIVCDRGLQPDRWIGRALPSAPGRTLICITGAGEKIEQEPSGRLWLNGERLFPEWLLDYGIPEEGGERRIEVGRRLVLVVWSPMPDGFAQRVGVSEPLLWVYRRPITQYRGFPGWLDMARSHVEHLEREARAGRSPRSSFAATADHRSRTPLLGSELGASLMSRDPEVPGPDRHE